MLGLPPRVPRHRAQFSLAVGVIFYAPPWMGFELLDTAPAMAESDVPMRVLRGNP
jgi:hypothetical protein